MYKKKGYNGLKQLVVALAFLLLVIVVFAEEISETLLVEDPDMRTDGGTYETIGKGESVATNVDDPARSVDTVSQVHILIDYWTDSDFSSNALKVEGQNEEGSVTYCTGTYNGQIEEGTVTLDCDVQYSFDDSSLRDFRVTIENHDTGGPDNVYIDFVRVDVIYMALAQAFLNIWDDTDYTAKDIGDQTKFYANYTNATGDSLMGALCNITFKTGLGWTAPDDMVYNSTSKLYEYNRSFSSAGTFNWSVTCSKPAHETETASDTVTIKIAACDVVINCPAGDCVYVATYTVQVRSLDREEMLTSRYGVCWK